MNRVVGAVLLTVLPCVLLAGAAPAFAQEEDDEEEKGQLGEFEDEANKDDNNTGTSVDDDDDDSDFFLGFLEVALEGALYGGTESLSRVRGEPPQDWPTRFYPRQPGEPVVPFFRADFSYMAVDGDVEAVDGRVEAGYGPLGFQYRITHFTEDDPSDELDLISWHGLYRMSFAPYLTADFGLGQTTLRGNQSRSGFSMTVPFRIQLATPVSLWARPNWWWFNNNSRKDYEVGVGGHLRYASLLAGYRWVKAGRSTLRGPVVKAAAHF